MKTIHAILAASLLLAAAPIALAEEGDCRVPPQEGIAHPLKPGTYLFLDLGQPSKMGEWTDQNRRPGLQTEACFAFGAFHYDADLHHTILP